MLNYLNWLWVFICVSFILNGMVCGGSVEMDAPALDFATLPFEEQPLHTPPLEDVATVLSKALPSNFANVSVSVVECPDLTQPPFGLTSPGISGAPRLIELGGPPFLCPLVQRDKVYDLAALLRHLHADPASLVGAGAGPWPFVGVNCEGIVDLSVQGGAVRQGSRAVQVWPVGGKKGAAQFRTQQLPPTETRTALLGNYLLSEGKPGKVIKVVAKNRTGDANFITSIREALQKHYGDKVVGLGGTFVLLAGRTWHHVMPDFSSTPLHTDDDVHSWLHFFEHPAPVMHVGTLVTGDLGMDLRVQHFHGYGPAGQGGHYHYDTTPADAHYVGYFTVAERVLRVDRPQETHAVGRD